MEVSIKRRLVGAAVLAAIAILVLPVLFDGSGRVPGREVANIPPVIKKPDTSDMRVDLPVVARQQPVKDPEPQSETLEMTPEEKKSGLDDQGNPKAWVLQLGSFKDSKNASKLVTRLRSENFRAFAKETLLSDGSLLTQVMVGPEQNFEKIEQLKDQLQQQANALKISGAPLIVRFEP